MWVERDVHECIRPTRTINAAITRHVINVSIDLHDQSVNPGRDIGQGQLAPYNAPSIHNTTTQRARASKKKKKEPKRTHGDINRLVGLTPIERPQQPLRKQPLLHRPQLAHARPRTIATAPHPFSSDEFSREQHGEDDTHQELEQAQNPDLLLGRRIRFRRGRIRVAARDGSLARVFALAPLGVESRLFVAVCLVSEKGNTYKSLSMLLLLFLDPDTSVMAQ